ncbi:MAG TPA: hypothetical protein ENN34_06700 [Deltaproteobacteria bacterium]|nr:hypothetical protein [Deltaproteobacteria bacterium]
MISSREDPGSLQNELKGQTMKETPHATLFSDNLMCLAQSIHPFSREDPLADVMTALEQVLVSIMHYALEGTDHQLHPDHSSLEKSSAGACFMTACAVAMISLLQDQHILVDGRELLRRAGSVLLSSYSHKQQARILEEGNLLFGEIITLARSTPSLEQWLNSVHTTTVQYVNTQGKNDYREFFPPLYLVLLMATGQTGLGKSQGTDA